jgi:hypothetical protein
LATLRRARQNRVLACWQLCEPADLKRLRLDLECDVRQDWHFVECLAEELSACGWLDGAKIRSAWDRYQRSAKRLFA